MRGERDNEAAPVAGPARAGWWLWTAALVILATTASAFGASDFESFGINLTLESVGINNIKETVRGVLTGFWAGQRPDVGVLTPGKAFCVRVMRFRKINR